jgi:hypothetical protein
MPLETLDLDRLRGILRQPAAWYAGFAGYAACVALFSGPGLDRWWGTWAVGGYALASAVAAWPSARASARDRASAHPGQVAALIIAVAGALVAPLAWLAARAPLTPDATVVMRSGALLLRHGTPYLPSAQLAHGGWLAYDPYLPVMAVFGLPKALGLPGLLGDERPWLAAATFVLLFAMFRIIVARRRAPGRFPGSQLPAIQRESACFPRSALGLAAFGIASPVMAFPLAMGITDPPVIAMICLALALLIRRPGAVSNRAGPREIALRGVLPAAVALGLACDMKYTAWPALAVTAVMVIARDGRRTAMAFTATALGTAFASSVALAPGALGSLAGLSAVARNTIAYPLGLTAARSPAQSPLPGHILAATFGVAGHAAALALLAAAGTALAVSLVKTPPPAPVGAAARIALGLTALFALCPATRFGYLAYPLALFAWALVQPDSAAFFKAARVSRIPVCALSYRSASCAAASAPNRWSKRARPAGSTSHDSVTSVPPETAVNVYPQRVQSPPTVNANSSPGDAATTCDLLSHGSRSGDSLRPVNHDPTVGPAPSSHQHFTVTGLHSPIRVISEIMS